MIDRSVRALGLACLGLAASMVQGAPATAPGAGLVLDESFELPVSANYTVVRAGQTFRTRNHLWQVEQASIDIVNTAVRHETVPFDGRQVIDLAGSPGPGVMVTRFATTPGQTYVLVLHYARNNGIGRTPALARVEVVGTRVLMQQELRHDPARLPFNSYRQLRGSFRADSAVTTLRFASLNAGNHGIVLDALAVRGSGGPATPTAPDASMAGKVPAPQAVTPVVSAMRGGSVEAKFRGTWVPAAAACNSPLSVVIEANKVSFVNGAQRNAFTKLEQCFTCVAGGMSSAPQPVWLTTDAMGDSPFTITLDGTRKTASVSVDFSNDKKLGARFPFGSAALKRCP
jgi:hypothetical protein